MALVGLLVLVVVGWIARQCEGGEPSGTSMLDSVTGVPLSLTWAIG